jgi:glycosyltransferase involved in cell wall biosynthesis
MNRLLVTVLINNYNYQEYLRQAIDSAIAQDYQPIEIIVVDDGSTDNSRLIISQYGAKIRVVFQNNSGQASAFNAGIDAAQGDIVCFLDSDDYWWPDKVTKVVEIYTGLENPGPLLVHHKLKIKDEAGGSMDDQLFGTLHKNPLNLVEYARKYKYFHYYASATSGMSINRSLAKMIFPLPQVITSADDFIVRAASLIATLYSMEPVLGTYRVHGANHWFSSDRRMPLEFHAALDSYLNRKLVENGIAGTVSYFDSMYCWWDLVRDRCWLELIAKMVKRCAIQRDKHTIGYLYRVICYAVKSQRFYQRACNKLGAVRVFARCFRSRSLHQFFS